ncbi:MAG: 2-phospho-L-lactate transferase [Acidimicrobiales bacterium]
MITVLSGGVGAARLLAALVSVTDPAELEAVVNVGDDFVLHGLTICPDLDTIAYTLAGRVNEETGWGRRGETWRTMTALGELGGETWFALGDQDLATHLYRTQRLGEGATKSEVTREIAARLAVPVSLRPVTDDPLATIVDTELGALDFQDYFVRRRHDVAVTGVRFRGSHAARPASGVLAALRDATRIVIAPSNPFLSIEPILAVPGVREIVSARRADVVAVSPLVGDRALKGPAARLLDDLGFAVSCEGVADVYRELVGTLVIDVSDASAAAAIRDRGMDVRVTTTVMANPDHARALARTVLA